MCAEDNNKDTVNKKYNFFLYIHFKLYDVKVICTTDGVLDMHNIQENSFLKDIQFSSFFFFCIRMIAFFYFF